MSGITQAHKKQDGNGSIPAVRDVSAGCCGIDSAATIMVAVSSRRRLEYLDGGRVLRDIGAVVGVPGRET